MANYTYLDAYVVLSEACTGLKCKFAFAFKSHSEFASLTGQTQSTRSENRINMQFKSTVRLLLMANYTYPNAYMVLSKIRTGLKREFTFVFKSQMEFVSLIGRTQSTRSKNRINMQFKSSSSEEGENGLENLMVERESMSVDVPLDTVEGKKLKKFGVKKIPMKLKEPLETELLQDSRTPLNLIIQIYTRFGN
ncbi:hypothetical protein LguiA_021248 [Lonicera macranthoides]